MIALYLCNHCKKIVELPKTSKMIVCRKCDWAMVRIGQARKPDNKTKFYIASDQKTVLKGIDSLQNKFNKTGITGDILRKSVAITDLNGNMVGIRLLDDCDSEPSSALKRLIKK